MSVPAKRAIVNLDKEIQVYLQKLATGSPQSTCASQKATLSKFADWYHQASRLDPICERTAAEFLEHTAKMHPRSTVDGQVDILANFCAYLWQDDPEITRTRISRQFACEVTKSLEQPNSIRNTIEWLIQHFRRSSFGSRIHACVELMIDTRCRFTQLRCLDIPDVDFDTGTVEVNIGDTHVVGKADLVDSRIEPLDESVTVLAEYIEYERTNAPGDENPLFTTCHGRASADTLRRDLLTSIENVQSHTVEHSPIERVTFRDIWEYSLYYADQ